MDETTCAKLGAEHAHDLDGFPNGYLPRNLRPGARRQLTRMTLDAGELLFLEGAATHGVLAMGGTSALVTIALPFIPHAA